MPIIIVGAGLAGACAAAALSDTHPVLVLEAASPAAGASGASAGLVNPFPGKRATPAWRHEESLDTLDQVIARCVESPVIDDRGIFRPAQDDEQASSFRERAEAYPYELTWLSAEAATERWPSVISPLGGLWVKRGSAVSTADLVRGLLEGITVRIGVRVTRFGEDDSRAWAETSEGERIPGSAVILAPGDGFRHIPPLAGLPLGRLKGQTIRVATPANVGPVPVVAGAGYVVPQGDGWTLGSTYERSFDHARPTPDGAATILHKASKMVRHIESCRVVDARAGVRVTVPARISRRRLPMVGPAPGFRRIWVLLGLGSKGLLTAPLVARDLDNWFRNPGSIPSELRLRIAGP